MIISPEISTIPNRNVTARIVPKYPFIVDLPEGILLCLYREHRNNSKHFTDFEKTKVTKIFVE